MGQYAMSDMRATQDKLIADYTTSFGVPMKNRVNFPITMQAEFGADFRPKNSSKNTVGIFINYAITKGQLGYSDFSGEVESLQDLSRIALGGKYSLIISPHFSFYGKASYVKSKLSFDEHLTLSGSVVSSNYKAFNSDGFSLEPGMQYAYNISQFAVKLSGGYELNFQGTSWLNGSNQYYLLKPGGGKAIIDWSGFRVGVTIEYNIKAK